MKTCAAITFKINKIWRERDSKLEDGGGRGAGGGIDSGRLAEWKRHQGERLYHFGSNQFQVEAFPVDKNFIFRQLFCFCQFMNLFDITNASFDLVHGVLISAYHSFLTINNLPTYLQERLANKYKLGSFESKWRRFG